MTRRLTLYSSPGCHLCDEARRTLRRLSAELSFSIEELHIDTDPRLHRAYFERIPVIALDGVELFDFAVDEHILRERLESRSP
ncbi:MAG TPA: glutaredoxin family protein [Solirubrobacteraceae bacterium]|nr:glutaredoxin family protein [Solirubrobacteraceae bacterium]